MNSATTGRLVVCVMASAIAIAACAGTDDAATDPEPTASEEEAGVDPLVVGMADYTYVDLPTSVPAGTTLTVENLSDTEIHELVAVRLPDDEDRSAEELVQLPPADFGPLMAGVRTVLLQAPGASDVIPAVGDGTLDEAGRYLVICVIPTGADPQEYLGAAAESEDGPPEVEGGPPHLVQGMWGELTVEDA